MEYLENVYFTESHRKEFILVYFCLFSCLWVFLSFCLFVFVSFAFYLFLVF